MHPVPRRLAVDGQGAQAYAQRPGAPGRRRLFATYRAKHTGPDNLRVRRGVRLAGVEVIVAEGFERIHRTNLIGMGVLPVQFKEGTTRKTLKLDGTETYDVIGERSARGDLTLVIHRQNGETVEVPVTCRLDTADEVVTYNAGGVLQKFAKDFLKSS